MIVSYLVKIDDDPECVAEAKDDNNANKDHGNALVPLLSTWSLLAQIADTGYSPIDETIGDDKNEKGKESHKEEISKKDVVSCVAWIFSHACHTHREAPGDIGGEFADVEAFISSFDAGIELIEPGDVPNYAQDDGG